MLGICKQHIASQLVKLRVFVSLYTNKKLISKSSAVSDLPFLPEKYYKRFLKKLLNKIKATGWHHNRQRKNGREVNLTVGKPLV
jgi:hypothetical protein